LYRKYSPEKFNLQDPRLHRAGASFGIVADRLSASASGRRHVESSRRVRSSVRMCTAGCFNDAAGKTNKIFRIRMLLEIEAFAEIHQAWKRVGYPFRFAGAFGMPRRSAVPRPAGGAG